MPHTDSKLEFSPDILRLLTGLLYPEPKMAIREILANAADALTEGEPLMPQGEEPRILVMPNLSSGILTVEDNGIGLSWDQANVLNMVGADEEKRKRVENLLEGTTLTASEIKDRLERLIGRYAIGRLACLCIASKVIIQSLSRDSSASEAVQWTMIEGNIKTGTSLVS